MSERSKILLLRGSENIFLWMCVSILIRLLFLVFGVTVIVTLGSILTTFFSQVLELKISAR